MNHRRIIPALLALALVALAVTLVVNATGDRVDTCSPTAAGCFR